MIVDSLAVEIYTRNKIFAGTNHHVFLEVAPGRKWILNEKVYDGDLFEDFQPGSKTRYVIDPAEGNPDNRLHLGDIEKVVLIHQLAASLPKGSWKPEWIRLEINGREVHRQEIKSPLDVKIWDQNDFWKADYPL